MPRPTPLRAAGAVTLAALAAVSVARSQEPPGAGRADRLRAQVRAVTQDVHGLAVRLPALKRDLEELTRRVEQLQASRAGPSDPPPGRIEFRPPLFRKSDKATNLAVVCRNRRIYLIDLAEYRRALTGLMRDIGAGNVPREGATYTVAGGDFDFQVLDIEVVGNRVRYSPVQVLKAGRLGETVRAALEPRSTFLSRLSKLDPDKDRLQFTVFPDSYEEFRAVRQEAWDRKFEMNWRPRQIDDRIVFLPGEGGIQ